MLTKKLEAYGANPNQIAKMVKKVAKNNPYSLIGLSEYAPAAINKRGNVETRKIEDIIRGQFEALGRKNRMAINADDLHKAGQKLNVSLEDYVANQMDIGNLGARYNQTRRIHPEFLLHREGMLLTSDIPELEQKANESKGLVKKAYKEIIAQVKDYFGLT